MWGIFHSKTLAVLHLASWLALRFYPQPVIFHPENLLEFPVPGKESRPLPASLCRKAPHSSQSRWFHFGGWPSGRILWLLVGYLKQMLQGIGGEASQTRWLPGWWGLLKLSRCQAVQSSPATRSGRLSPLGQPLGRRPSPHRHRGWMAPRLLHVVVMKADPSMWKAQVFPWP